MTYFKDIGMWFLPEDDEVEEVRVDNNSTTIYQTSNRNSIDTSSPLDESISLSSFCQNATSMLHWIAKTTSSNNNKSNSSGYNTNNNILTHCCHNGKYWENAATSKQKI